MSRLLYLFSHYPRWSETFLRQDLKLLQATGLPVLPVALYPGDCPQRPEWPQVTVLSQGSATAVSSTFAPKRLALRLPPRIQQMISLCRHRKVLMRLINLIQDQKVTAIHAEFADLAALLASEAARQTCIPYSLSIHAYDVHACKFPLKTIYGRARKILVCNQAAQDALLRQAPRLADRTVKIYHGLVLKEWPYLPPAPLQDNNAMLKILFVGRLVPKKGLHLLFQGLALAQEQGLRFSLELIGEGPCESPLRELAQTLHISNHIIWHGRIERSRIPDFMRKAHLFFMPSIVTADKNQDGIPNVIVEAMASGLPVMGSQAGSLSELLTEKTGWPVPELTPQNIAAALQDFLHHPQLIPDRTRMARTIVEQQFDAEQLALRRLNVLNQSFNA